MGLLPIIKIWRLWNLRCKARIEGKMESCDSVWLSIRFWMSKYLVGAQFSTSLEDDNLLTEFQVDPNFKHSHKPRHILEKATGRLA